MARTKKKLTPNQQALNQQIKRLQRAIKDLEKQGWNVSDEIKNTVAQAKLPRKRVSKQAIQKLQAIKRQDIRNVSDILDVETGELILGKTIDRKKARELVNKQKKLAQSQFDYEEIPYSDIPAHIDVIEALRERILEMERKHPRPFQEFEVWKNSLLTAFDDNVSSAEVNNTLDDLRKFFSSHLTEILSSIEELEEKYPNRNENANENTSYIHTLELINGGEPLPADYYEALNFQYLIESV